MSDNLGALHSRHVTLQAIAGLPLFQVENPTFAQYSPGSQGIRPQPELCQVRPQVCQEKPSSGEHLRNTPGTREIPLTKGMVALVDAADYELASSLKWYAARGKRDHTWYAVRSGRRGNGRRTKEFLHRLIAGCREDVDHRDGNGLNNTRANLRPASIGENNRNIRKPVHGVTSQYKGVCWHPGARKFQATIRYCRKNYYLGLFKTEAEAAWAYDREARLRFGAFARCNFPPPPVIWRAAA